MPRFELDLGSVAESIMERALEIQHVRVVQQLELVRDVAGVHVPEHLRERHGNPGNRMILVRARLAGRNPRAVNVPVPMMRLAVGGEDGVVGDGYAEHIIHRLVHQVPAVLEDRADRPREAVDGDRGGVMTPRLLVILGDLAQARRHDTLAATEPRAENVCESSRLDAILSLLLVLTRQHFAGDVSLQVKISFQSLFLRLRRDGLHDLVDLLFAQHPRDLRRKVAAPNSPQPRLAGGDQKPTKFRRHGCRWSPGHRTRGSDGDFQQAPDIAPPRRRVLVLVADVVALLVQTVARARARRLR